MVGGTDLIKNDAVELKSKDRREIRFRVAAEGGVGTNLARTAIVTA